MITATRICAREGCGEPCPPSKSRPFIYCSEECRPSVTLRKDARVCLRDGCGGKVTGSFLYCDDHRAEVRRRFVAGPPRTTRTSEVVDPVATEERAKRLPALKERIEAEETMDRERRGLDAQRGKVEQERQALATQRAALATAARSMVDIGRAVLKALGERA